MGLFGKRSGVYVIVCYLDGQRCYVDEINFYHGQVFFTQDVTRVGHFFSKEEAQKAAEIVRSVRGVSRVKIYDDEDDRWY
ncbi:MAG: hypothetical protein E7177_01530 [Erysipelotrichaceae bacterium]|nr:hypothetical protein [Erysipelotrichaceae bacterium]